MVIKKKPIKKGAKKIPEKNIIEKEISEDSITNAIDIIENDEEKNECERKDENSLPEAIKALCDGLFKDNHIKMGKISGENKKGMTTITVLNTYFENRYGYTFNSLESLKEDCMMRNISIDGFGIASLVEALKSVNMSIETSSDNGLVNRLLKR